MQGIANIAVIFAGGVGSRMRSRDIPKQFLVIHGKPIIIHTLEHFERCENIDAIVIACVKEYIDKMRFLVERYGITKVKDIVPGGATGQQSIYNGLVAAKKTATVDKAIVLIHDGVRPLINEKVISENIESVKNYGSCITAGIVKETIVEIDDGGNILNVPERKNSRVAKAPQSFYLNDILSAHEKAISENKFDFIDSCTMMKHYGHTLHMIDGPYENIKITTPDDYYTMRAILDVRENNQIYGDEE
ncbi:MAG: 2-C-methyl-D-erythritol 4-phosphate cytidylyltransferase [Clostridiales bacterium]|nr:2-C-methyl-D-erythritol 4-phosphate cytidylyltransferase [Clostridiales bacterium]